MTTLRRQSLADWLLDDATFTTSIALILTDVYEGIEWTEWDPHTVEAELRQGFRLNDVPRTLMDRIQAASVLYTTNLFQVSFETFNVICQVLNGDVAVTDRLVPANLADVNWGVVEARTLTGDDWKTAPFSHDIARYVGVLLDQKNISEPPHLLRFAEYPDKTDDFESLQPLEDPLWAADDLNRQVDATAEINQDVHEKLRALLRQVAELPIQTDQEELQKLTSALG